MYGDAAAAAAAATGPLDVDLRLAALTGSLESDVLMIELILNPPPAGLDSFRSALPAVLTSLTMTQSEQKPLERRDWLAANFRLQRTHVSLLSSVVAEGKKRREVV